MLRWLLLFHSIIGGTGIYAQTVTQSLDTAIITADKLGNDVWAFASQSVINMRRAPGYPNELITQALLGTPLKILAKKNNWYLVQTPEGYEGWTSAPMVRMDSVTLHHQNKKRRVVVMDNNAFTYAQPKFTSDIIMEVVMGSILWLDADKRIKGFYKVSFPDGRVGYIAATSVKKWEDWKRSIQLTGNSIEAVAKRFMGVPYFWGGTSPRGLDCSGLTKTAYLMHGIILPRDARQQYMIGTSIDSSNHFSNLQKGDLLFFGKKYANDTSRYNVVHTGIYLQNGRFLHAGDGCIQVGSLMVADSLFDKHNYNRYIIAKRILNKPADDRQNIFTHPWYQ